MDSNTMEEIRRIESAMQVSVPALVRQYKFMVNRGKNIEDSGFDALIIAVEGSILPIINNLILSVICRGHWLAIMTIQGLSLFSLVVPLWWAYTRLQRLNAEAKFLEQCCVNLSDLAKTFGGELNGMLARMNLSRASLPNTGIKIYLDTLDQVGKSLSALSVLSKLSDKLMKMLILPLVQVLIVIPMCVYLFSR